MNPSILPRSLQEDRFAQLLSRIVDAELKIKEMARHGRVKPMYYKARDLVISMLAEFRRSVRPLQLVSDFSPPEAFEEHDQVASLLLYQAAGFEALRNKSKEDTSFLARLRREAATADAQMGRTLQLLFPRKALSFDYDIGILTVLEQEYQSVVRRLDTVEASTDWTSFGQAILDRREPFEDLKRVGHPERSLGWTTGTLGHRTVRVICTGEAGKDNTFTRVREAVDLLGQPKMGWLVVGVCAATNDAWPLGSVLVSKGKIFDLFREKSTKYRILNETTPLDLGVGRNDFQARDLFRRVPGVVGLGAEIAKPTSVPVHYVRFACTDHLVNELADRETIRATVFAKGGRKGEHIGIEMEAQGVAAFGGESVCIVKAVCDYADSRKSGKWSEEQKMGVQLYASELAADFLASVVLAPGTSLG